MQQSALTDETNVQGQVKRRRTLNIYARRILASLARSWPKRRERAPTAHTGLVPHSQFVRNITGEVRRKREKVQVQCLQRTPPQTPGTAGLRWTPVYTQSNVAVVQRNPAVPGHLGHVPWAYATQANDTFYHSKFYVSSDVTRVQMS